jgi:hypothetical protein
MKKLLEIIKSLADDVRSLFLPKLTPIPIPVNDRKPAKYR